MTTAAPDPSAPEMEPTGRRGRTEIIVALVATLGLAIAAVGGWMVLRDDAAEQVETVESIPVALPRQPGPAVEDQATIEAQATAESPFAGNPRRIVAAAIGLDAPTLPIRVVDGALTPPRDASKLGWDEGTSIIGAAEGTSVVAGHTLSGKSGALADLGDLAPGDAVAVLTDKGQVDFIVRSVDTYRKTAIGAVMPELYAADGANLLVLITCSDWTGSKHLDNTVVVAEPVDAATAMAATS